MSRAKARPYSAFFTAVGNEASFAFDLAKVAAHFRALGQQVESCALTHAWIDDGRRPCEGEKLAKFGAFALRERVVAHLQTRSTACHRVSSLLDRDRDYSGVRSVVEVSKQATGMPRFLAGTRSG